MGWGAKTAEPTKQRQNVCPTSFCVTLFGIALLGPWRGQFELYLEGMDIVPIASNNQKRENDVFVKGNNFVLVLICACQDSRKIGRVVAYRSIIVKKMKYFSISCKCNNLL